MNRFDLIAADNSEHAHQTAFFSWLDAVYYGGFIYACGDALGEPTPAQQKAAIKETVLMHAIPNGGLRNKTSAIKLRQEGVKAGVWDVFYPVPKNKPDGVGMWHGIYIEFKSPKRRNHKDGGLTVPQRIFADCVNHRGYKTAIAYTWREAAAIVMEYYGLDATDMRNADKANHNQKKIKSI